MSKNYLLWLSCQYGLGLPKCSHVRTLELSPRENTHIVNHRNHHGNRCIWCLTCWRSEILKSHTVNTMFRRNLPSLCESLSHECPVTNNPYWRIPPQVSKEDVTSPDYRPNKTVFRYVQWKYEKESRRCFSTRVSCSDKILFTSFREKFYLYLVFSICLSIPSLL